MCVCAHARVYVHTLVHKADKLVNMSAVSAEARREHRIPWLWSYSNSHLLDVGAGNQSWVFFQEPGRVRTHWGISSASTFQNV